MIENAQTNIVVSADSVCVTVECLKAVTWFTGGCRLVQDMSRLLHRRSHHTACHLAHCLSAGLFDYQ